MFSKIASSSPPSSQVNQLTAYNGILRTVKVKKYFKTTKEKCINEYDCFIKRLFVCPRMSEFSRTKKPCPNTLNTQSKFEYK